MGSVESVLYWITLGIYALGCSGYVYAIVFRNERVFGRLPALVAAGFLLHTATIAALFIETGHLPWAGDYEAALMGCWFIILLTLVVVLRRREHGFIAVGTVPATLFMMGFGVMRKQDPGPMAASLKTFWLYFHVYFAWLAYGAYTLAMAAGVVYLLKHRDAARQKKNPIFDRMPPLERLDELMFRYVTLGFITNAFEMAAGAIWAKDLWGSYWSWDPLETWALVGWLEYGLFIHLRGSMGWRGVKLAWISIVAYIVLFISFFGVSFAVESSRHIFNMQ